MLHAVIRLEGARRCAEGLEGAKEEDAKNAGSIAALCGGSIRVDARNKAGSDDNKGIFL
jgi:hypothetical protein